jgi:hypothetical protein
VHDPPRHRIRGRPPPQRVHRELVGARRQHQVAESAAAQHRRVGDQADVRKDGPDRRHLRAGVPQRRAVGHVDGEDPGLTQRAAGRVHELRRGQVGRRAAAGEDVCDDHVVGTRRRSLQDGPGVADLNPDPPAPRWQPEPDQPPQGLVYLHRHLPRGWPGRGHVTGQRERSGAQVQHPQRLTRGRGQVDQVPEPPDVLEIEVAGIVQVDMRLRDAVDQQHPRRPPVGVAQELGAASVQALLLLHRPPSGHSCHYRRLRGRTGWRLEESGPGVQGCVR